MDTNRVKCKRSELQSDCRSSSSCNKPIIRRTPQNSNNFPSFLSIEPTHFKGSSLAETSQLPPGEPLNQLERQLLSFLPLRSACCEAQFESEFESDCESGLSLEFKSDLDSNSDSEFEFESESDSKLLLSSGKLVDETRRFIARLSKQKSPSQQHNTSSTKVTRSTRCLRLVIGAGEATNRKQKVQPKSTFTPVNRQRNDKPQDFSEMITVEQVRTETQVRSQIESKQKPQNEEQQFIIRSAVVEAVKRQDELDGFDEFNFNLTSLDYNQRFHHHSQGLDSCVFAQNSTKLEQDFSLNSTSTSTSTSTTSNNNNDEPRNKGPSCKIASQENHNKKNKDNNNDDDDDDDHKTNNKIKRPSTILKSINYKKPSSSILNLISVILLCFAGCLMYLDIGDRALIAPCDSQFLDQTNEVAYVDLRVKDNSIQHHTVLYEQIDHINPLNPTGPSMVLRRGEQLNIVIHLRQIYNKNTDKIRLEFSFGPRPQVGKGTLIYLPIAKDRDSFLNRDGSKWDARVVRVDGNQLQVQINIPANIAIGVWRFKISTKLAGSRNIRTYALKESLYIIFNAWSKDDAVYLSREDARQEYVLNDVGKIYIGSHAKPRGRKWIYGQFQESVLPAVMFMLDKTRLDITARANVVKVARAVSAMVNSHDDNGLLVGNWSGNYGDGLAPWQWTGSATILEKYLQSGGEPVKFGQCWVFAGVTTTALRTLGIPARTVSNFVSAHDTDDSLTVDKFFSEKGDPISDVNSDSIWNFHVWSDAWMARNDLPPGYGGWQAVDATPQETSMGMYQMGPASLEAIKKGEVGFAYDAAFVFAEVNADIVHWQQDDKSELQWKKIKTLKFHIGRKIFTKMIGQLDDYTANGVADAEDIISQYKNKEGTEDERMSVLNAARCGGLGFLFEQPAPGKEDVDFELHDLDKVLIGDSFAVSLRISNRAPARRTISLALSVSSVYYTGILAQKVKRDRQNIVLNSQQEQLVKVRVNPEDYMDRLVDFSMMKIYAIATVKETQQTWSKEDDFMIEKLAPTS